MSNKQILTHVTYRAKKGGESTLLALVKKHWPTIHALGLTTDEPATLYRAVDKRTGAVSFIEIFSWKDKDAPTIAHETPEVMAVWEPMGSVLDELQLLSLTPMDTTD